MANLYKDAPDLDYVTSYPIAFSFDFEYKARSVTDVRNRGHAQRRRVSLLRLAAFSLSTLP